jgi:hypothetical protein
MDADIAKMQTSHTEQKQQASAVAEVERKAATEAKAAAAINATTVKKEEEAQRAALAAAAAAHAEAEASRIEEQEAAEAEAEAATAEAEAEAEAAAAAAAASAAAAEAEANAEAEAAAAAAAAAAAEEEEEPATDATIEKQQAVPEKNAFAEISPNSEAVSGSTVWRRYCSSQDGSSSYCKNLETGEIYQEYIDESTGELAYYNEQTQVTAWCLPGMESTIAPSAPAGDEDASLWAEVQVQTSESMADATEESNDDASRRAEMEQHNLERQDLRSPRSPLNMSRPSWNRDVDEEAPPPQVNSSTNDAQRVLQEQQRLQRVKTAEAKKKRAEKKLRKLSSAKPSDDPDVVAAQRQAAIAAEELEAVQQSVPGRAGSTTGAE